MQLATIYSIHINILPFCLLYALSKNTYSTVFPHPLIRYPLPFPSRFSLLLTHHYEPAQREINLVGAGTLIYFLLTYFSFSQNAAAEASGRSGDSQRHRRDKTRVFGRLGHGGVYHKTYQRFCLFANVYEDPSQVA